LLLNSACCDCLTHVGCCNFYHTPLQHAFSVLSASRYKSACQVCFASRYKPSCQVPLSSRYKPAHQECERGPLQWQQDTKKWGATQCISREGMTMTRQDEDLKKV
jgi:hypothetical protein